MSKFLYSFLLSIAIFSIAFGQVDCSNVPELMHRTNDYAEILSLEEEKELSAFLKTLEDEVGSQVAILTIDTLDGEKIESYSLRVANCWGLGRKDYDDGLLITVVLLNRQMRIEVGYGLEKIIKDEIAKNIIDSEMVPEFQKAEFYNGIKKATFKIDSLIRSNTQLVGE
ncbi:MAG: TPM domain-containing protein [Fulvivirga sp.]|uniref:TPM domain-containing protein n=1 Tax=Fulvivirga sp. TaxID=1931237 RepID=UPI0032ECA1C4